MSPRQKFETKTIINLSSEQILSLVNNYMKDNNDVDSIQYIEGLLNLVPEHHEIWEKLANLYKKMGDNKQADNALNQFALISNFNHKFQVALDLFKQHKLQEADLLCRQLLQLVPDEIRTLRLLAKISASVGRYDISIAILSSCLSARPLDVNLAVEHAKALLDNKQEESALEAIHTYQVLHPNNFEVLSIKANAEVKIGDYQSAENTYRNLIELNTETALCLLRLGNVLKIIGKITSAIECYLKALSINPNLGEAYWNLANTKTHIFTDTEVEQMKDQLNATSGDPDNEMFLNFAMGKAFEDNQQYASSFDYYQRANTLSNRAKKVAGADRIEDLTKIFNKNFFKQNKPHGHTSEEIIFIVGLPRSGSTLIEQILASHSLVDGTMELTSIPHIVKSLDLNSDGRTGNYPTSVNQLSALQINDLAQKYLASAQSFRQGGKIFTDKLPANFQHIGLIKLLFPKAKIIDVRRNPMACGWSIYSQFFASGVHYAFDLENIGKHYNKYIELMDHWHKVLPQQILTVHYEELIGDFEPTVKTILDYCQLELEESCLTYFKNERPVATPSAEQVRQAPYTKALEHWRNYEDFLIPLSNALKKKSN